MDLPPSETPKKINRNNKILFSNNSTQNNLNSQRKINLDKHNENNNNKRKI